MLILLQPVALALTLLAAVTSHADVSGYSHEQALAHSQAAIGRSVQAVELTRSDGTPVTLADYRGKPLLVSMIYTSCHHVCPTTTQYLQQVVKKARAALGQDSFQVVSIGFDTSVDDPARMAQFRQRAGLVEAGWDMLSGDADNMDKLVRQLGFIYYASPKGFDHLVQASLVDAEGVIYRQVYGMSFPIPGLIEPLKQLVFDKPEAASVLDYMEKRIRLFCTVYDAATDTYQVDISVFIGTGVGLLVSLLFGTVLVKEWRKSLRSG